MKVNKEDNKFNQREYITKYKKEHYSQIKFELKKDEAEEFRRLLKIEKTGISEFLKKCVKNFKEINKNY